MSMRDHVIEHVLVGFKLAIGTSLSSCSMQMKMTTMAAFLKIKKLLYEGFRVSCAKPVHIYGIYMYKISG